MYKIQGEGAGVKQEHIDNDRNFEYSKAIEKNWIITGWWDKEQRMKENLKCRIMTERDIDLVVPLYIEHYNN